MAKRGADWIGGIFPLPGIVTGEGVPDRPEVLIWMAENGAILGTEIGRPGELLGAAGENLGRTIGSPTYGAPHAPNRIRVASPELAETLSRAFPSIEIVCGPTPELDEALTSLSSALGPAGHDDTPYLTETTDDATCASFCRAAAGLFRAAPWEVVPSDEDLLTVTVEALGVHRAVISVIGQMGDSYGIVLFRSLSEHEDFLDAAYELQRGRDADMPAHLSLNYGSPFEVPPGLRREIEENGWELAGEDAYPWLISVDPDVEVRTPTPDEVGLAEAVAFALPHFLRESDALDDAWERDVPFERTVAVETAAGEVTVTLAAPTHEEYTPDIPVEGLLAELRALEKDEAWNQTPERGAHQEALLDHFAASPEGRGVSDPYLSSFTLDLAASHLGRTVASLRAADLDEVVFELIPRKASIEASEARSIIEANRAFFTFLGRVLGLPQAGECLEAIGKGSAKRLEDALSDPSNFGMAKSFVMEGAAAGFDMSTSEGLEAWMEVSNRRAASRLPGAPRLPPDASLPFAPIDDRPAARPQRKKVDAKKAKKARKAKRKSARRNRKKK